MTNEERVQLREYAERWKRLGPLLEAQREEDVRRSDTVQSMTAFGRLFYSALQSSPPKQTSGLVDQQRIFMRLRNS